MARGLTWIFLYAVLLGANETDRIIWNDVQPTHRNSTLEPLNPSQLHYLHRTHPLSSVSIPTGSLTNTSAAVSKGEADATFSPMATAIFEIKRHRYYQLEIAGTTEDKVRYRIGVRKQDPQLHAIISKAVRSLDPLERDRIITAT